jgi:hypothetical protein
MKLGGWDNSVDINLLNHAPDAGSKEFPRVKKQLGKKTK